MQKYVATFLQQSRTNRSRTLRVGKINAQASQFTRHRQLGEVFALNVQTCDQFMVLPRSNNYCFQFPRPNVQFFQTVTESICSRINSRHGQRAGSDDFFTMAATPVRSEVQTGFIAPKTILNFVAVAILLRW